MLEYSEFYIAYGLTGCLKICKVIWDNISINKGYHDVINLTNHTILCCGGVSSVSGVGVTQYIQTVVWSFWVAITLMVYHQFQISSSFVSLFTCDFFVGACLNPNLDHPPPNDGPGADPWDRECETTIMVFAKHKPRSLSVENCNWRTPYTFHYPRSEDHSASRCYLRLASTHKR